MARMESVIKSEIVRLSTQEARRIGRPLRQDVRLLRNIASQLRKSVSEVERFVRQKEKERTKQGLPVEATPEEVKKSRFSPRLLRSLRKQLRVTQKELAVLAGVTVGAAHLWEKGKFRPKEDKMAVLVGLRKLGREGARKLLAEKGKK